jgi:hypothetical protein
MDIRVERREAQRPPEGDGTADLTSLADVIDRLTAEFEPALNRNAVTRTVRHCRRELDIIHGPAPPEPVERLARQRLRSINRNRTKLAGEQRHDAIADVTDRPDDDRPMARLTPDAGTLRRGASRRAEQRPAAASAQAAPARGSLVGGAHSAFAR